MATTARNRRLAALALATATMIGVVGIASPARATHDDDGDVTVTSAGDPANPVTLSTTPNVGETARLTRVVNSVVAATSPAMPGQLEASSQTNMQAHVAVQSADPDGGYAAVVTVEAFDQTVDDRLGIGEDFGGFFPADLGPIVGVAVLQHFEPGRLLEFAQAAPGTTLTAEQDDVVDALVDDNVDFPYLTPDTPVGQGATWAVAPDDVAAIFPFALDFALISLKGDRFVIDMSFEIDLAEMADLMGLPPGFEELSGRFSGHGRFFGVFAAPLLTSRTFSFRVDMAGTVDGIEISMTMDYTLDETAYPA